MPLFYKKWVHIIFLFVGHDWVTELNWTELYIILLFSFFF